MPGPEKAEEEPWQIRRKQLNNIELWQRKQDRQEEKW